MKKRLVFILNPMKGEQYTRFIETAINDNLDTAKFDLEFQFTKYPKHGTELAREAAQSGAYGVVAAGGDGTINDIVKGIINTNAILGILPGGSGNGLARSLNIPLKIADAVKVINRDHLLNMDVAFANGEPFVSNAGVAFDALVAHRFAKASRHSFPFYAWLAMKNLWSYKEWEFEIIVDGQKFSEQAFILNIANAEQMGYNFSIAPQADCADGWLDLVIIKKMPKMFFGGIAARALMKNLHESRFVTYLKAKEISVSHPKLRIIQTDGDSYPSNNRVNFTIQPGAQKVLIP